MTAEQGDRRRRAPAVCAAAAAALALSSCGAGDPGGHRVASLSGPGSQQPSAVTSPTVSDSGRPQIRLDSSLEDINRMLHRYYACLQKHGHRMYEGRDSPAQKNLTPQDQAAKKACLGKRPMQPPQMDKEKNPNYLDDYHHYITCLQGKGMPIHAIQPFGTGWTYNKGASNTHISQDQKTKIDRQCKVAAFGD